MIVFHKAGRYVLPKPTSIKSALILNEVYSRSECSDMVNQKYYKEDLSYNCVDNIYKIELWKNLQSSLLEHPLAKILNSYGIEVSVSATLSNYIKKEVIRQEREKTPYPAIPVANDGVSLYGRCSPGTSLRCIKDYYKDNIRTSINRYGMHNISPLFAAGNHYLVVNSGEINGLDQINICKEPVARKSSVSLVGADKLHSWVETDPALEEWFDDSESVDFGQDLEQKYPALIAERTKQLNNLPFIKECVSKNGISPLYKHNQIDAVYESLKRGVVDCKLMRLGKSSSAITTVELWGSKKVAIIGTKNVRLAFKKEFQRMGIKDSDYVLVNNFTDLETPAKYYLFTMDWLKEMKDSESKSFESHEGYLKPSKRTLVRKITGVVRPVSFIVHYANYCPYCEEPLERMISGEKGTEWVVDKGYICRNSECSWQDVQKKVKKVSKKESNKVHGAAWENNVKEHKAGSYVDYELARHINCQDSDIKGRQCVKCGLVNSSWIPPRYKRVKDLFNAVIADEIHNAKNIKSQNAKAVYSFRARRRIALTGTLLSNSPLDAYWPLHWAMGKQSSLFPWQGKEGLEAFKDRFCDFVCFEKPSGEIDPDTGIEINKIVKKQTPFLKSAPDWWRTMQPIIVRRNYSDPLFNESLIAAGMKKPEVVIHKVNIPMDVQQAALYRDALQDFKSQWQTLVTDAEQKGNEVNKTIVIAKMASLRMIATVPEKVNQKFGKTIYTGPDGGGKMYQVKQLVKGAVLEGKKVFVISDFVEMQIQLERALKEYNPVRMLPSWGDAERLEAIDKFSTEDDCTVCIASTRSVREAIDLSVADVTICCDLLWSPAWQAQAWSRTLAPTPRERTCDIYLLLSENTLDDYIYTVFYSKYVASEQALDKKVMARKAVDFNVRDFVSKIIADENAINISFRDDCENNEIVFNNNNLYLEERV
jgi:hypothetical protein